MAGTVQPDAGAEVPGKVGPKGLAVGLMARGLCCKEIITICMTAQTPVWVVKQSM